MQYMIPGQHCILLSLETNHFEALFQAFSVAENDRDWTRLGAEKPACLEEMMYWINNKIKDRKLIA
jgi:hypothetical protein